MSRSLSAYVTAVTAVSGLVTVVVFLHYGLQPPSGGMDSWIGLFALMVLTAVSEGVAMFFSAKARLSISLIPIVAIVPLFGPALAVAATAFAQTMARTVLLRQGRLKAVFNVAQFTLAIGLGAIAYSMLGGPVSDVSFDLAATLLPFGGLIGVYFFCNTGLVSAVIALDTGRPLGNIWMEVSTVAFVNDVASSFFALFVVFAFVELGLGGLLVVLLPLFFVHHSYGISVRLHQQNKEILELLVKTIEAKDPYTSGHSQRVARLSRQIAEIIGLSSRKAEEVEVAALLHDIGKIDFAYAEFLNSSVQLTDYEKEVIRSHPQRGARLLGSISSLSKAVLDGVRHHHEHYDGTGYPAGLKGEAIPIAARIVMVADTVDAMLSNRPYRLALSADAVAAELKRFSGSQFDPFIVRQFLESGLVHAAERRAEADRTPLPAVL